MPRKGRRLPFNNLTQAERWKLVKSVAKLCHKIARKHYHNQPSAKEDFIQEAFAGAWYAATAFDPARGMRFITYATPWIRQFLQNADPGYGHTQQTYILAQRKAEYNNTPMPDLPKFHHISQYATGCDEAPLVDRCIGRIDPGFEKVEQQDVIEHMVSLVCKRYRGIFRRFLSGMSFWWIGREYGISKQAVHKIITKQVRKIRERMDQPKEQV